jgi:hypothetical protein
MKKRLSSLPNVKKIQNFCFQEQCLSLLNFAFNITLGKKFFWLVKSINVTKKGLFNPSVNEKKVKKKAWLSL